MKQVAIIGLSPGSHGQAPIADSSWECWGLIVDHNWPHYERLFEVHPKEVWEQSVGLRDRMVDAAVPLYMLETDPEIWMSCRYPVEDIRAEILPTVEPDYLGSSCAYMLALAIYELGPGDRIGLWGFGLHGDEGYSHQRSNIEYLLGFAKGKGIDVWVSPDSAIFTLIDGKTYGLAA